MFKNKDLHHYCRCNNTEWIKLILNVYRVDAEITPCTPHRTGLTDFPYPALQQELNLCIYRMR